MDKKPLKQSILVVDDIPENIDVLRGILRTDYKVKAVLNGKKALQIAASSNPPDLILLDIMMPEMDGYEVCRRLKANPLTRSIPVIFVTAKGEVSDEAIGFTVGAVDYITKPVSPPIVKARVKTHLALYDQSRILEGMVRKRTAELRRSLLHLEQERTRFRWVVQQADDGYLIVNRKGELLYTNPQACLYLGLPLEPPSDDDVSQPETFIELVKRQYQFETEEAWATPFTNSTSQPHRYLVRPESPTAKDFWIKVDVLEISAGREPSWLIRLRDVTEQVGSQRDKRAFTYMVYHKMRTPLMVMITGLEIMTRYASQLSTEEIVEYAQSALNGIGRLRDTIEDVLAYLQAPDLAQEGEGFKLSELRPAVAEISSNLDVEKVSVTCPQDLMDDRMLLSHRAMELILWELLENTKKFHPGEDPTVEIRVSRANSRKIRLQVRDDGMTASPEHLAKFWIPYYQGEKDFTGEVPGMGLGLAMVASLVWGVGGSTLAYNREGGPGNGGAYITIEVGIGPNQRFLCFV